MNKDLIIDTLSKLEILESIKYDRNLPMDNLLQVKSALDQLGIEYKTEFQKNETIILKYKNKLLSKYTRANYPNNKFLGQSICNNKFITEYYLNLNKVPTPNSKLFYENDYKDALNYIEGLDAPFVIKALDLRQGVGVYTNVDHENFESEWKSAFNIQKKRKSKNPMVLIQNQLNGLEVRINVTEGKVESAILRLQGFLIGDGVSTIEKLIYAENEKKKLNPYLNRDMILFDDDLLRYISKSGKSLDSVLDKDEMLILNDKPEIRYGMETYNVTSIVKKEILEIGLNSVLAIPGLHTAGVDIIIPHLESDVGHVIEVNKNPAWALSLYAVKGDPGEPVKDLYQSHLLDHRILNDDIKNMDDITKEEFTILMDRFKFLFKKDQYNRKIISEYHKNKFSK